MYKTLIASAVLAVLSGAAFAGKEPTHHLCSGIYAHIVNDGSWSIFRSNAGEIVIVGTKPSDVTLGELMTEYCGTDEHPHIHD